MRAESDIAEGLERDCWKRCSCRRLQAAVKKEVPAVSTIVETSRLQRLKIFSVRRTTRTTRSETSNTHFCPAGCINCLHLLLHRYLLISKDCCDVQNCPGVSDNFPAQAVPRVCNFRVELNRTMTTPAIFILSFYYS